jgi:hypothetical protein
MIKRGEWHTSYRQIERVVPIFTLSQVKATLKSLEDKSKIKITRASKWQNDGIVITVVDYEVEQSIISPHQNSEQSQNDHKTITKRPHNISESLEDTEILITKRSQNDHKTTTTERRKNKNKKEGCETRARAYEPTHTDQIDSSDVEIKSDHTDKRQSDSSNEIEKLRSYYSNETVFNGKPIFLTHAAMNQKLEKVSEEFGYDVVKSAIDSLAERSGDDLLFFDMQVLRQEIWTTSGVSPPGQGPEPLPDISGNEDYLDEKVKTKPAGKSWVSELLDNLP